MQLNSYRPVAVGYEPPPLPEGLCGPRGLADMLIHARRFCASALRSGDRPRTAPLSDEGVRGLVDLAYYTSLLPEEGRFPRFKLVCREEDERTFLASRFEPVPLDRVDALRRLAPACTRPECALLVAEREGGLRCEGVAHLADLVVATVPGIPGPAPSGSPPAFRVEVFAPGHIRVGESPAPSYEIRAGRVRPLSPYVVRPATDRLRDAVQRRMPRAAPAGERFATWAEGERPFLVVLSKMLRTAVDARHGGAFVFLPAAPDGRRSIGLEILYRTGDLDLGDDLVRQRDAFAEVGNRHGTGGYEEAIQAAELRRAKSLTDSEAVGNFSCVDGCVVLTHGLKVLGFGAKILVSAGEAEESRRRFKHLASGAVYDDGEFLRAIGGTRHQSVARLCQAHAGVVAYTVSQDGELKLFCSDADFAYAYGPLDLPTMDNEIDVL